ncbi:Storkhead box 1 [Homalodisca vitripennis]|nr:Storkhead box 1 [Homalodisca vitripennis]
MEPFRSCTQFPVTIPLPPAALLSIECCCLIFGDEEIVNVLPWREHIGNLPICSPYSTVWSYSHSHVSSGTVPIPSAPLALVSSVQTVFLVNLLSENTSISFCPESLISFPGDVEDCLIQPISQGQFTPLPEALCWVILDLTSSGQVAVLDTIRAALQVAFPEMERPSKELVYDTLAKLMTDRKLYQTSRGYFVVTPESRRLRKSSSNEDSSARTMLLSTEEAVALVHGEMETVLDGERTHQAVQTNLADVICGGL